MRPKPQDAGPKRWIVRRDQQAGSLEPRAYESGISVARLTGRYMAGGLIVAFGQPEVASTRRRGGISNRSFEPAPIAYPHIDVALVQTTEDVVRLGQPPP